MKPWWIFAITVLAVVGALMVIMRMTGPPKEDRLPDAPVGDSPGGSGAAPASPDETPRDTKTDRDSASSPGTPARDQSFRSRWEMSKKVKAVAVQATRDMVEHRKQYPHSIDDPVARAELKQGMAATTDPKERAALTRKFLEAAREGREAAKAAQTPEVLQHERRLRTLSRLESFLDLPAYISEGTEFSGEAEALLVKVADFAERSAELDDEAVITEFSTLDSAIKDLRRRRAESIPKVFELEDD